MLVLTRKSNETIVIDGNIRVRVLEVRGGRVRLGIEAPEDIGIRRGELPARDAKRRVAPVNDYLAADLSADHPSNGTGSKPGGSQDFLVCESDGGGYLLTDLAYAG